MGYCISLHNYDFILAAEHKEAALAAMKALPDQGYSWVDINDVRRCKTLEEALREWRYEPEVDDGGNIIGFDFTGEKIGDEDRMFAAIALFVKHGSYIEMLGEDSARWRWKFANGQMKEISARIIWDDDEE